MFENEKPEELLLLVWNLQNMTEATGAKLSVGTIQLLCNLLDIETLCKFESLLDAIRYTTNRSLTYTALVLGTYFTQSIPVKRKSVR